MKSTGSKPSQLRGYTEVAGIRPLIVANPAMHKLMMACGLTIPAR